MKYSGAFTRRVRQLRRVAVASTRRPMWRGGVVVPAHWWDGHPNFGDDLTPWLLPNYGVLPIHRVASRARLAGVGSILEFLPADWDGVVWGSGLMYGEPHSLPRAQVLAVRGYLTMLRSATRGSSSRVTGRGRSSGGTSHSCPTATIGRTCRSWGSPRGAATECGS
jgi:hypothetical protein